MRSGGVVGRVQEKTACEPSPVLPPSDEGGGKPEGLDGGRDKAGLLQSGGPLRGSRLRALSLSRLRRQLPRQREPRGLGYALRTGPSAGAKPRGRRGAGVHKMAASESANGGFRGAFRFPRKTGFAGPPGNFMDFRQMNCRKSDAGTRRRGV